MPHTVATKNLLAARIGTVWPEVKAAGIYVSNQLQQIDFETKIKSGALPIAVLDFRQTGSHEFGGDAGRDLGPVTIYRVVADSETLDQLIGKVEALRDSLWLNRANLLPTCQLLTFPTIEFHMDQPLQRFFWETMKPLLTASVMLTLESGEG
jgi:hypothetical protein